MTIFVFVVSLLAAMALGMPLAFSLIVSGVALMLHLNTFDTQIISQNLISGADNFPLMAVPFFMLAGELMNAGGLSRRIVNSAMVWVGHFKGGLGYVAVFAAVVMASLSGSAVADTAALAAVLMPMMKSAGYRMDRSAGLIAAGGIIAPVIPPSIGFILFGVIGGVSISKLFMAGIFPGILMGVALVVTWWIVARKDDVQVAPRVPMREKVKVTINAFWAYLLAITIIGGMKAGIFTPTEAAVVAVVYSVIIGKFVYRELDMKALYDCLKSTGLINGATSFLIGLSMAFASYLAMAQIPAKIAALLVNFVDSPFLLMMIINVFLLVLGCFVDNIPAVIILTPILLPVVRMIGIDTIHFGLIITVNLAIGFISPPYGINLFVASAISGESIESISKEIIPSFLAMVACLLLFTYVPALSMGLVRLLR